MNIGIKLRKLKQEDFIWYIYFFIAAFALYSNYLEKDYYEKKNKLDYKKAKTINIVILTVAFFIYLYFVINTYDDLKYVKNDKEYMHSLIRLGASLIFLVGGIIYLILEITDNDLDEVGFI